MIGKEIKHNDIGLDNYLKDHLRRTEELGVDSQ